MKRREFIQTILASTAAYTLPLEFAFANPLTTNSTSPLLILVELKGGNDGLNTLVPFTDPAYYRLRPTLALSREAVLPINEKLGLNSSLTFLHQSYKSGNLAVLQGLGYSNPNLSHFRSIDIWETASAANQSLQEGWLTRALHQISTNNGDSKVDGIVVGDRKLGPLRGANERVLVVSRPKQLLEMSSPLVPEGPNTVVESSALAHIQNMERLAAEAKSEFQSALKERAKHGQKRNRHHRRDGAGKFSQDVMTALRLLELRPGVRLLKLSIDGFDTHADQAGRHQNLLRQLDDGLKALVEGLKELGLWQHSLVLTYSEFGRRPTENRSRGTDHGTANVHFALGSSVRGGIYGESPSLTELQNENLVHTIEYQEIYATVLKDLFKIPNPESILGNYSGSVKFIIS